MAGEGGSSVENMSGEEENLARGQQRADNCNTESRTYYRTHMHKLVTDEHVTYHTIGASLSKPHTSEKASL